MWGTAATATITGEGQAAVFITVHRFAAACAGTRFDRHVTRFQALEPIRQRVRRK